MLPVVHFFELAKLVEELDQDISLSNNDEWPPILRIRPMLQQNWSDRQGMIEYIVGLAIRFQHNRRQCLFSFFYPTGTFRRLYSNYWGDGESRHAKAITLVEVLEFEVCKHIKEALPHFVISDSLIELGDTKLERGSWKNSPLNDEDGPGEE